jgi:hypothetical protein
MITCEEKGESNPLVLAKALYKKCGLDEKKLFTDIEHYAKYHIAYVTVDYLILSRHIDSAGWFVELAVGKGCLQKFMEFAPMPLAWVGFNRPGNGRWLVKWYPWETCLRLCTIYSKLKTN